MFPLIFYGNIKDGEKHLNLYSLLLSDAWMWASLVHNGIVWLWGKCDIECLCLLPPQFSITSSPLMPYVEFLWPDITVLFELILVQICQMSSNSTLDLCLIRNEIQGFSKIWYFRSIFFDSEQLSSFFVFSIVVIQILIWLSWGRRQSRKMIGLFCWKEAFRDQHLQSLIVHPLK